MDAAAIVTAFDGALKHVRSLGEPGIFGTRPAWAKAAVINEHGRRACPLAARRCSKAKHPTQAAP
eukprot:scaffold46171_cov29-Tisochrysis_lutea.AAC.7